MIINNLNVTVNRDIVFHYIDCNQNSPVYEEVLAEFERIEKKAYQMIHSRAVMAFGNIAEEIANERAQKDAPALFVITTLGREISDWVTNLFEEGNYLAGTLVNAFADTYLLQTSEFLTPIIKEICKDHHVGIKDRLEAPQNIVMEAQKLAYDITDAQAQLNMSILESYMYDPVKSMCQIFILDESCAEFHMDHSCKECSNLSCKMRRVDAVKVNAQIGNERLTFYLEDGQSLFYALRNNNIYLPAVCAARGNCGKCRIRVGEGILPASAADRNTFSEAQISDGWRLACTAYPKTEITIVLDAYREDSMEVVGSGLLKDIYDTSSMNKKIIGIDIGTTTIAMEIMDTETSRILDSFVSINRQRLFGADVISRIQAYMDGQGAAMQECIKQDLLRGLCHLTRNGEIAIEEIIIAGNTTMQHLLFGYPCNTLGVYPFTPYQIDMTYQKLIDMFGNVAIDEDSRVKLSQQLKDVPVTIMPGISTFVGADIVSDMLSCNFAQSDKINILIDLGTNGEMAIGNHEKIMVTSVAAGPAFEGGNITDGIGSVPGAICEVVIEGDHVGVKSIQDAEVVGICGTGVIEAIYELLQVGYIDEMGLLIDCYRNDGFLLVEKENGKCIRLYQKDIREFQLAKAAVRAGIEILLLRYGIKASEVNKIYFAGGFGYSMNIPKAIGIGLIPEEFFDKIEVIGNGSLKGALKLGKQKELEKELKQLVLLSQEINLSGDKDFNDLFMEYIVFPDVG